MKRFLTMGLIALAAAGAGQASAQSKRVYDDDIYYNSKQKAADEEAAARERRKAAQDQQTQATYTPQQDQAQSYSSGSGSSGARSYTSGDYDQDYIDYDDDFSYATQFNRFNTPFYNRPYWSTFNNPYWYNPYWVDPYWGWSPWMSPGIGISFGTGPYWSSYWGWNTWYGYGGFNSYYYPGYAWGGGYGGFYGGYYGGYWNGYYAGLYNNYGSYRNISYGPRFSMNANRNNLLRGATFAPSRGNTGRNPLLNGQRIAAPSGSERGFEGRGGISNSGAVRNANGFDNGRQPIQQQPAAGTIDRSYQNVQTPAAVGRDRFNTPFASPDNGAASQTRGNMQNVPDRGFQSERSFQSERGFQQAPVRSFGESAPAQAQPRSFESPRSFEAPQRTAPPSRGFDGGSRGGFGGGGGGFGGGGGGFRGGGGGRR